MSAAKVSKQIFTGPELDELLSYGFFRSGTVMYKSHAVRTSGQLYNVIRIRFPLEEWHPGSTYRKLKKRNADLRMEIKPFTIDHENEELFDRYRLARFGDVGASLNYLVHQDGSHAFPSEMFRCYDGEQLIACAVTDMGETSAAGILFFYDHEHARRSLGKFLIYTMIVHMKTAGIKYYYPGYILPGNKDFDYKMDVGGGCTEFLSVKAGQWLPCDELDADDMLMDIMIKNLKQMQRSLHGRGIPFRLVYYYGFDAPVTMGKNFDWNQPFYLNFGTYGEGNREWILSYDMERQVFEWYTTRETKDDEYQLQGSIWIFCMVTEFVKEEAATFLNLYEQKHPGMLDQETRRLLSGGALVFQS
jgi:arginine-tRNA-protein transferase